MAWALWGVAELLGRGRAWMPALVAAPLLALLGWRAWAIGFLPLTNKYESFVGFATVIVLVASLRYARQGRAGKAVLGLVGFGFLATSRAFDDALRYPSPLLYTAWYLAHVPLSFGGYAYFLAAAGDGLDYLAGSTSRGAFFERQEANLRVGLLLFSGAMIFGGVWGVVSWGAYFLWDPKVIWSLISWLFFATMVHTRYWPLRSARLRVALGLLGLVVIAITFVGTSFMTGSIHAF